MREASGLGRSLKAIIFNSICLCSLVIIIILFSKVGKPYHRGFFCDDTSISKPYKEGTVSAVVAGVVGLFLPAICILIIEVPRYREGKKEESKPFYKTHWFRWMAVILTFFAVGAGANTMLTDVGKYTIGRLRPHFLAVCKPDFSKLNCSTGSQKNFITENVCTGDPDLIREARLSFPSGHASFSAYCMMFLVLYIEIRMSYGGSMKLFKPFTQMILLLLAVLCGMSRVSDYKHHWSDVLAGLILGTLLSIFFIYRVLRLHQVDTLGNETVSSELASIQQRNSTAREPELGEP